MIPFIELHHVFVNFRVKGDRTMQALHDVSLQINPGDMIAVVGESGCGKSTLGKVCLGLQKPSKGAVFFDGAFIWDTEFRMPTELRCAVQVVHQDSFASLNPVKTVFETLGSPLLFYRMAQDMSEAEDKVHNLLKMVDLTPSEFFINKYPFQLSGGQRQRVSIARATILKPRVIIADEPVSAVDASLRLSLLDLMKRLNSEHNIAFLYITHDLATARYFAPQGLMIVMYLGRVIERGIIDRCVTKPGHPYLQALISAIPASDPQKAKQKVELPLKSFDMPSATNPPPGCVFHPRCPYGRELCEKEPPQLLPLADEQDRLVACHFRDTIPRWKPRIERESRKE